MGSLTWLSPMHSRLSHLGGVYWLLFPCLPLHLSCALLQVSDPSHSSEKVSLNHPGKMSSQMNRLRSLSQRVQSWYRLQVVCPWLIGSGLEPHLSYSALSAHIASLAPVSHLICTQGLTCSLTHCAYLPYCVLPTHCLIHPQCLIYA